MVLPSLTTGRERHHVGPQAANKPATPVTTKKTSAVALKTAFALDHR